MESETSGRVAEPVGRDVRRKFHDELEELETHLASLSELVDDQMRRAVAALCDADVGAVQSIVDADDEIDRVYLAIEKRWHEIMAMQTPVAVDLRLMSAIMHINHQLERIGDVAVNIAKTARKVDGLPRNEVIVEYIREMGDVVRPMIRAAMKAFADRDIGLALQLPEMDDVVDGLNRRMYREVGQSSQPPELLEWAIRMMVVSRHLERVGDHAVDIAEQVAFLLTGIFREFGEVDAPLRAEQG